ncbi:MAG: helix-turn-helix domain-containing protein [Acidimicrobiales bacterium]
MVAPYVRVLDGRVAKGERTRLRTIEALVELVDETGMSPTTLDVAERAGVSVRSIYRHFPGDHGLLLAAADFQARQHRALVFDIPPKGPSALRIRALCRQRRLYFEEITPVYRLAHAKAYAEPGLQDILAVDRAVLHRQLARTLAPELESRGAKAPELLEALEQATDWDAWRALRDSRGRTAPSAERLMAFSAVRILG